LPRKPTHARAQPIECSLFRRKGGMPPDSVRNLSARSDCRPSPINPTSPASSRRHRPVLATP
jgi:hypothetical protein